MGSDEDLTPVDTDAQRPASNNALRLKRACGLLGALAEEFRVAGGMLDQLPDHERPLFLLRICDNGRQTVRSLHALIEDMENESGPGRSPR